MPFELRKGERKTQGKNERDMEGKEKGRKETVETKVVHSGLLDTKKTLFFRPTLQKSIQNKFNYLMSPEISQTPSLFLIKFTSLLENYITHNKFYLNSS